VSFDEGSGLCVSKMDAKLQAAPRLKLLLEFEPAHRVFFRNLGDAVLRREPPRLALTSRPGTFWNDVFIYSGKPWRSFFESILWHVFVVAVIWVVFLRGGPRLETAKQQQMFHDSRITYYAPSKSFPATESRRSRPRPKPKASRETAHQQKIRVTPERTAHTLIMPPDLMLSHSTRSDSVISKVAAANHAIPAMPLAATGRSRRTMSAGVSAAVAPSPDVNQTSSRRLGLPQAAAVAPAPEVGAGSPRRAVAAPSSAIVAPPPTVQGSMRRAGDVNIGRSAAVAPAPELPMQAQGVVSGTAKKGLGGVATSVVPPPPTVGGAGMTANGRGSSLAGSSSQAVPPAPSIGEGSGSDSRLNSGRGKSLSTAGMSVVPPAPSVEGGNSTGGRHANSLSGTGSQVVAPAPAIGSGGDAVAGGRRNSLSGTGAQAVPPSPSVDGGTGSSGNGRGNSLAGTGMQVVPPPASIGDGSGTGGTGRMNSLGNGDAQVAPPDPSTDGVGNSAGSGSAIANSDAASPVQVAADDHKEQAVQELPVNLIGLVLALPGTSYFSNYEVFVARRRTSKDETVLIKLVYEFLPYQRRLSEYDLKNTKVYKLTVVRDATCDETLAQMLSPQIDESRPAKQYTLDPAVLGPNDPNAVLMCYRTTADDFRKSIAKAH
jgi:hypothetical protein